MPKTYQQHGAAGDRDARTEEPHTQRLPSKSHARAVVARALHDRGGERGQAAVWKSTRAE